MVQGDVGEVGKTLTPLLSVVRQYLAEMLSNIVTSMDTSTQPHDSDKPVVSDELDLKSEESYHHTSVLRLG